MEMLFRLSAIKFMPQVAFTKDDSPLRSLLERSFRSSGQDSEAAVGAPLIAPSDSPELAPFQQKGASNHGRDLKLAETKQKGKWLLVTRN